MRHDKIQKNSIGREGVIKNIIEKLVRWLVKKYLPGIHVSRNPVRKQTREE